ncbi:hypothetical protein [Caulobacter sp. NIBR2454]|uniref:hypothetical protein n=1 Tax=Caulobacter sp. NIBR2454 TaxID=3015996 RepID=UPI0022B6D22E|nr:hypothetical protein [Caulobacter sp. NIBR2454]
MITFDSSLLLGYYQSRAGVAGATAAASNGTSRTNRVVAPWASSNENLKADALVKKVLGGRKFIDEGGANLESAGAAEDHRKLFALHQGLAALSGLIERAGEKGVTDSELTRLQSTFAKGLEEVEKYTQSLKLDGVRFTTGQAQSTVKSTVGVEKSNYNYNTGTIYSGKAGEEVPAFQGAAAFKIQVKKLGVVTDINVDLSEMGSTPRTMQSVAAFINDKFKAAGLWTTFAVKQTKGAETEVKGVNGETVKLPAKGDDFSFLVKGDMAETLTFSAPTSAPAVYVTTRSGDPDPDKDVKTDDGVFRNTLSKINGAFGTAVGGSVFTETLQGTIDSVEKTITGADGSIYMLANVSHGVNDSLDIDSQAIKGKQDVALLKYDSSGNLMFARSLGAAETASGLNLAVSADGKVAVAGSVTGELTGLPDGANGPLNSGSGSDKSDSFVTLYDTNGDETWTVRRGALESDSATALAFGADGTLYVAGNTSSGMAGHDGAASPQFASPKGGQDGYLTAFATQADGKPKSLFTTQFGTSEKDSVAGLVVDGDKVYVAGVENGRAVVRNFDVALTSTSVTRTSFQNGGFIEETTTTVDGGAPSTVTTTGGDTSQTQLGVKTTRATTAGMVTSGPVRDLGALGGGSIAGLVLDGGKLWIGGSSGSGALTIGNQKSGPQGRMDGFAASLSLDLASTADDVLTYYGGAEDDTVTGMAVAGGKVYLTGLASKDLGGTTPLGKQDGYVAQLDMTTGAADWMQRISGKDGIAAPTSIAVDAAGASALDTFGLPRGQMFAKASELLVSGTGVRPGDQFQIRTRPGGPLTTVTIDAKDTLDTLADKIRRASGSQAKVEFATTDNRRQLRITAAYNTASIEIVAGKGDKDALEALGLSEGLIYRTREEGGRNVPADGKGAIWGLQLAQSYDLTDKLDLKEAKDAVTKAMTTIQRAYRELLNPPAAIAESAGKQGGTVPAYLTKQIASYQNALAKLTGG